MKRIVLSLVLIAGIVLPIAPAAALKANCKTLKQDIRAMIDAEYDDGDVDAAKLEFAVRTVKAYKLSLNNKRCLSKKELGGLLTGIQDLKTDCQIARKDSFAWAKASTRCNTYKVLYKYLN